MKVSKEKLIGMFIMLSKIRKVALKIEDLYHLDEMKTPVHLPLGQEASSVGVCANLTKEDYIFSNHRSHAHYLAKGGDLKKMIAELYCKETGCSKARGGSMHLIDTSVNHLGSSAIVCGGVPNAMGAAFAAKYRGDSSISVAFLGDAACEEGVLYETMNFAALKKLPLIFVVENNKYSVCSHISARQPNYDLDMRSKSFGIPSMSIDGMKVVEVYEKSIEAIQHVRSGKGPYLLECKVQRWRGHAGAGDPLKDKYRAAEDLDESKVRDPIEEYLPVLLKDKILSKEEVESINAKLDQEIEGAFKFAQESPLPKDSEVTKYVYVE